MIGPESAAGASGGSLRVDIDRSVIAIAFALFAAQAGIHSFTATIPLALAASGYADAQIGLAVAAAALTQIAASVAAGPAIDNWGAKAGFLSGSLAYLAGAAFLIGFDAHPHDSLLPVILARVLQGFGAGVVLPSALAIVPRISRPANLGFSLAIVGSANNLALIALPGLSIAILGWSSLSAVSVFASMLVVTGAVAYVKRPKPLNDSSERGRVEKRPRRYFRYRSTWTLPLVVVVLLNAYWGIAVAYLPQHAAAAGANIGLFFTFDGVGVLLFRIPAGWFADRASQRSLMLAGVAATLVAVALLFPPPTTLALAASGLAGGVGSGLAMTTVLLELARRSAGDERGGAFGLLWAAFASATAIGSIAGAPLIAWRGLDAALALGVVGVIAAGAVVLYDPLLNRSPGNSTP